MSSNAPLIATPDSMLSTKRKDEFSSLSSAYSKPIWNTSKSTFSVAFKNSFHEWLVHFELIDAPRFLLCDHFYLCRVADGLRTAKGTPVQVSYHISEWTEGLCRLTLMPLSTKRIEERNGFTGYASRVPDCSSFRPGQSSMCVLASRDFREHSISLFPIDASWWYLVSVDS